MTPTERAIINTICNAIQERKIIEFYYSDTTRDNADWRRVEPYLIGLNKKTKYQLRAWFLPTSQQIINGENEGWRLYNIAGITKLSITDDLFYPHRPLYNPNDKAMIRILCRV